MFHSYWDVLGFGRKTDEEISILNNAIYKTVLEPTFEHKVVIDDLEYIEFHKSLGENFGIFVLGYYKDRDSSKEIIIENAYPYVKPKKESFIDGHRVTVQQMSDKIAYLGMFDSYVMNMVLIFFINSGKFISSADSSIDIELSRCEIGLSALASTGMILIPLEKKPDFEKNRTANNNYRVGLLKRMKRGDDDAAESMAMDEFETQQMISDRIKSEDVLSIVESYFIPDGLENDKYAVMGDIISVEKEYNEETDTYLYCMAIMCNDACITIVINENSLIGEPKVGRRFRGKIWLQGEIAGVEDLKY